MIFKSNLSVKIDMWFLSIWKKYDRGDSFIFNYELKGSPFG